MEEHAREACYGITHLLGFNPNSNIFNPKNTPGVQMSVFKQGTVCTSAHFQLYPFGPLHTPYLQCLDGIHNVNQ